MLDAMKIKNGEIFLRNSTWRKDNGVPRNALIMQIDSATNTLDYKVMTALRRILTEAMDKRLRLNASLVRMINPENVEELGGTVYISFMTLCWSKNIWAASKTMAKEIFQQ